MERKVLVRLAIWGVATLGTAAAQSPLAISGGGTGATTAGGARTNLQVLGQVNSVSALESLSLSGLTSGTVIALNGYYVAGDIPEATYSLSTSACTLNGGVGDGGSEIPSNTSGNCWVLTPQSAYDPRWWGAVGSGVIGGGSTSSSSNLLSLNNSDGDWEVGQPILVVGAGGTPPPSAPTVGSPNPSGISGSTTYCYEAAAVDANGGISVPSSEQCTTVGPKILGMAADLRAYNQGINVPITLPAGAVGAVIYEGSSGAETFHAVFDGSAAGFFAPAAITAYSVASDQVTVTITGRNTFHANQAVTFAGLTSATFLNGLTLNVLSTGLSGSQFEVKLPTAQTPVGTTPDSGSAVLAAQITLSSLTGNVATFTASNTFTPGQTVTITGLTNPGLTGLNGSAVTVLAAGLSSSQFTVNYTHANVSQAVESSAAATLKLGITAYSVTSNIVTLTATNTFAANQPVTFSNLTSAVFLNGLTLNVLSTGLSGSQFLVYYPHSDVGTTTDSGSATPVIAWTDYGHAFNPTVITGYSISSGVITFFASNSFKAGQTVIVSGLSDGSVNGTYTISAIGLKGSQFESTTLHSDASVTDIGLANVPPLTVSSYSVESNVVTLALSSNPFQAGVAVTFSGLSSAGFLNGQVLNVLSTGLTSTQIEVAYIHADVSTTTDSGTVQLANVQSRPLWIPTVPLGASGQNDWLATTISSISAGPTITMTTNAGATVSGMPVLHDSTGALGALAATGVSGAVPCGTFYTTAPITIGVTNLGALAGTGQSLNGAGMGCAILHGFGAEDIVDIGTGTVGSYGGLNDISLDATDEAVGNGFTVNTQSRTNFNRVEIVDSYDCIALGRSVFSQLNVIRCTVDERGQYTAHIYGLTNVNQTTFLHQLQNAISFTADGFHIDGDVASFFLYDSGSQKTPYPQYIIDDAIGSPSNPALLQAFNVGFNFCSDTCIVEQVGGQIKWIRSYVQDVLGADTNAIYIGPQASNTTITDSDVFGADKACIENHGFTTIISDSIIFACSTPSDLYPAIEIGSDAIGTSISGAGDFNQSGIGSAATSAESFINIEPGAQYVQIGANWGATGASCDISDNQGSPNVVIEGMPLSSPPTTVVRQGAAVTITVPPIPIVLITQYSVTANVVTLTANNSFTSGQAVTFSNLSSATFLNGQTLTVLSTGLSSTQFEVSFTYPDVSSTADSGRATPSALITGYSVAGNQATLTANNNFAVGQLVTFSGLTSAFFLNGLTLPVHTSSSTQFSALIGHSPMGFTTDSGVAATNPYPYAGVGGAIAKYCRATNNATPFTDMTDTALNIMNLQTDLGNSVSVGFQSRLRVVSTANGVMTLGGGSGVTMSGITSLPPTGGLGHTAREDVLCTVTGLQGTSPLATITQFSISGNVVTFTASNALSAGQAVVVSGLSTGTYLNNQEFTVLSSGLSPSQFEVSFTHANVSATGDNGTVVSGPTMNCRGS